jgi:uncharacterized protein (TIGR03435 family)
MTRFLAPLLSAGILFAQPAAPAFDVASVKPSEVQKGVDYRGTVVMTATRVGARNVTLKDLIAAAFDVQHHQIAGGPRWIDSEEFDIEAKVEAPAQPAQLREILQGLLDERFHLTLHREWRELRVHALVVDKGGLKIQPAKEPAAAAGRTGEHFHGTMRQLADLIAIQATIPAPVDPGRPAIASSEPIRVVDKTGLDGVYDFDIDLRPELGTDQFTGWQRALREQLGLRLESQNAKIEMLVVTHADRVPVTN